MDKKDDLGPSIHPVSSEPEKGEPNTVSKIKNTDKKARRWGRKLKTDDADAKGDGDNAKKDEEKGSTVKNFIRILSFGSKRDYLMIGLCTLCAIGSGAAMPLMFLVRTSPYILTYAIAILVLIPIKGFWSSCR